MKSQDRKEIPGTSRDILPSLELYRMIFQAAPQGMVVQDAEGTILIANSAAERFLGLSLEQMEGMASTDPRWQTIHEDGSPFPGETHPAMVALRTGKPIEKVVMGVFNPSLGRTLWIEINSIPLFRDGEPQPCQVYTTFVDISERMKAEYSLRKSEEKFARIFRLSPDAIDLTRTIDGVSQDLNNSYTKMFGYTPEEFIGRSTLPGDLGIWVNKEDRDRHVASLKAYGEVYEFEAPLRRKDGSSFIAQISSSALEIDGESFNITITRDISARKQAEESLRESEERYQRITEAITDYIYTVRVREGRDLETTHGPGCSAVTGYQPNEFTDDPFLWINMVPEEDRPSVEEQARRILAGEDPPPIEHRILHKNGTVRWVRNTFVPHRNEHGALVTYDGLIQDITERKKAEDSLRRSEEKFSKAFHASPDSININRLADGVYLAVNEGFTRITGYTAEEVLGHSSLPGDLGLWVNGQDRERLLESLRREGLVQGLEAPFRRKDGTVLTGLMSANLIEVQGELCILTITRDLTERIRAEEEKARLQFRLQQAQALENLGTLAGGVAHDMNNVLGAVLGIASANIESHTVGSPSHHAFETIIKAAERGGKMVKSLLSLGHRNSNQEQELDLNTILCDEVQLLEHTTLANVHLTMDLQPDLRLIRGEASDFNRAFMNIFVNALDAMPDSGRLSIRTRNVGEQWIEVEIEDTGIGMPREVLERAMDPFFTTKPIGKGTGLGLSMVHNTVNAHRGQIEIQSEPRQGTLVRMRFPVCAIGPQAPEPSQQPRADSASSGLNVLFIDDDELIQHSTQALLETLGHRVNPALNGEEALSKLEAGFQPDIVILDMNMPGLGGSGTLPRLRALNPTVRVVIATAHIEQAAMDLVKSYPYVTLLSKPYTMRGLQQHLEIACAPVRAFPPTIDRD
jgi:PAS domain S-box-containing protein